MAKKGIDVSYANGSIDWSKVKSSGVEFAILRSTFGSDLPSQIDSQYFQNAQGCIKNGIPFGTYHFAYFVNEQKAREEADFAIKKANEYKQYVKFIVLDVEEDSERYAKSMGYNPDWTACSIVFLERVKSAGYIPILYSNYSWLKYKFNFDKLKNYKLWYAAPDANKPAYDCALWQYSWKGKVNGISGDVDMNYLYDNSLFSTTTSATKTSTASTVKSNTTVDDKAKFLNTARSYIGKDGAYVCKTKLGLNYIVDWCAYSVSAIMKDCGFIGKYQGGIYSYASDNARNDDGKYGTWFLNGTKAPQAGDLIMFKYASFTNPIDKYSVSHVGIVENVNGNTITTLEGNVDGNSSNWAATSTFKRKTRYLNDSDVYSFFRFNWKSNTTISSGSTKTTATATATPKSTTNIDVNYKVYANNKWLPSVTNTNDYAGIENKPIYGVCVKPTKGHIKYRVKLIGGSWLPWVQDIGDFAGATNLNRQIDCIQMTFTGVSGYSVEYRVSTANSNGYLPWVKNYNNTNDDGYAGIKGAAIDKLQVRIVRN